MPVSVSPTDIDVAASPGRPTVLIADAHAPTRAGVRQALASARFKIVGETASAEEAVAIAAHTRPDICLMEVLLPGGGIRAARVLTARLPDTAVVMLTASSSEEDFFDALRAGVAGYLLKSLDPGRLPHALEGVLAGESAVPRSLVPRLMEEFRRSPGRRVPLNRGRGPALTAREWETVQLLREGLSTAEIAVRLSVSPVTVRRHLSSVIAKLRVQDREAVLRLLDEAA